MARRFAFVLIWLALTAEVEGFIFEGKWATPLTWVGTLLFKGLPFIHVVPWDALIVGTLIVTWRSAGKAFVPAMTRAIRITLLALFGSWVWGMVRGGSAYQTIFQLHAFVLQLFVALLVIAVCRTMAHVEALLKLVVFAAVYRAFVLLAFYLLVARHLEDELPTLTDHADSVLFVSGLFIMVLTALERRTSAATLRAFLTAALMFTAITLNGRRIAWLDVGVSIFVTYLLFPKNKLKKRVNLWLLLASPLLVAYVAVGWGNPTGIFKPVGSVSTMFGENQDTSSIMRDIENYNLMRTLKVNPVLGVGWGHEYIEEVRAFDISNLFPQYRYLPHNSLLGVIAFAGAVGFAGIWQVVPTASFFLTRVYHLARGQVARIAALSSLLTIMMVTVQMWGDVGFNHGMVNVMLGISLGLAARLPMLAGVMPVTNAAKAGPAKAPEPVGG